MISLHLFFLILLVKLNYFAPVEASGSKISDSSEEDGRIEQCSENRLITFSSGMKRKSKTILINKQFDEEWRTISIIFDDLISEHYIQARNSIFNFRTLINAKKAQSLLIEAIHSNSMDDTIHAIRNGARFFTNGALSRLGLFDNAPIEIAVVLDKVEALEGMLQSVGPVTSFLDRSTLHGVLLIRAVQAGHLRTIRLLVEKYKAPYLKDSFLFQRSIMHKAPVSVVKYILSRFGNKLECYQDYGKHQDFPLHLAVRYNNDHAFAFLFSETKFNKNILNGDGLRAIDLIFTGWRGSFLVKLFADWPHLRLAWLHENGDNLLHMAVNQNNFEFVKFAIQTLKFPVDCPNAQLQTALLLAIINNNPTISAFLMEFAKASIFNVDNIGMYPILFIAQRTDITTFKFALETLNLSTSPELSVQIIQLTQTLIHDQNWLLVNILFSRFEFIRKIEFVVPQSHLGPLLVSPSDHSALLVDYFIKRGIVDPKSILHDAILFNKFEIVEIVIFNGISPDFLNSAGKSALNLAIEHNRPNVLKLLLSCGGWTILDSSPNHEFVYLITNGASFLPLLKSRIHFETRGGILTHFFNYFLAISETLQFDPQVLAAVCIQSEIFLFYYVTSKPLTADVASILPNLVSAKKFVSGLILEKIIELKRPFLSLLLNTVHWKNIQFLSSLGCNISSHQIKAQDLMIYIDEGNNNLIKDYDSIIVHV